MSVITRPLPSLLDEDKVRTFVREVEVCRINLPRRSLLF